ncbi:hypothetical protein ACRAVF_21390 [Bradyrhizobium oligotrophicum S58]
MTRGAGKREMMQLADAFEASVVRNIAATHHRCGFRERELALSKIPFDGRVYHLIRNCTVEKIKNYFDSSA